MALPPGGDEPPASARPSEGVKPTSGRMVDDLRLDGSNRSALFDGSGRRGSPGTASE
ncbi:hypothetical protein [Streptomyces chumphonensis]|uniref:hypothetical protein n=1 Tax=Streptomyces chumphonensis TaxID=1214925 RepID=UPI003D71E748